MVQPDTSQLQPITSLAAADTRTGAPCYVTDATYQQNGATNHLTAQEFHLTRHTIQPYWCTSKVNGGEIHVLGDKVHPTGGGIHVLGSGVHMFGSNIRVNGDNIQRHSIKLHPLGITTNLSDGVMKFGARGFYSMDIDLQDITCERNRQRL